MTRDRDRLKGENEGSEDAKESLKRTTLERNRVREEKDLSDEKAEEPVQGLKLKSEEHEKPKSEKDSLETELNQKLNLQVEEYDKLSNKSTAEKKTSRGKTSFDGGATWWFAKSKG